MRKSEKYLLAGTIILGVVDLFLVNRVYLKKKGVVLKDMVITGINQKLNGASEKKEEGEEARNIPIDWES